MTTKSRTIKNSDEENLNPLNCKIKAGFPKFYLKSSSPSAWALSPGRSLGSPLEPAAADGGRKKLGGNRSAGGGGAVSGVLRFFTRPKKAAVVAEAAVDGEEVHRFRVLENRLLQWKFVNVRAETSMANVKTLARVFLSSSLSY